MPAKTRQGSIGNRVGRVYGSWGTAIKRNPDIPYLKNKIKSLRGGVLIRDDLLKRLEEVKKSCRRLSEANSVCSWLGNGRLNEVMEDVSCMEEEITQSSFEKKYNNNPFIEPLIKIIYALNEDEIKFFLPCFYKRNQFNKEKTFYEIKIKLKRRMNVEPFGLVSDLEAQLKDYNLLPERIDAVY
ncbi:MAG: hypothetical protein KJ559_03970 [Nanoarchaeota archaeon]|nr:hypothetical protein [Nanoarchaeota archaeon]